MFPKLTRMMLATASLCVLLNNSVTYSQITITRSDILDLIGQTQTLEFDTVGNVMVDVGTPGGSRLWNFAEIPLQSRDQDFEFLAPGQTPFFENFPRSNFVQKATFEESGQTFESYVYLEVANDSIKTLGAASSFFGMTSIDSSESTVAPLPVTFGSAWTDVEVSREEQFTIITLDSTITRNIIDAWGTVRLEEGDIQCLRICAFDTTFTQTIVNNIIINSDTTTEISYNWISKSSFLVAAATSQEGESDPNFNNADSFFRLSSGLPSAVDENRGSETLPTSFDLAQNFPNPFNPETIIRFSLGQTGHVKLAIFDSNGREIRELVSHEMPAGFHSVRWDGRDQHGNKTASGHYIYRLSVDGIVKSKVMALVK